MNLAVKLDEKYNYADYLSWPADERWEIIEGVPFLMSPAPSREHQEVAREFTGLLYDFFKDKECELYFAPFDVRLAKKDKKDKDIFTVVQPDILVVCDKSKLDDKGCVGAPDFIIEISSPSTAGKDAKEKLDLYEKHGVKEYWIAYPEQKMVMVFRLNKKSQYGKPETYYADKVIETSLFPELKVEMLKIFPLEEDNG